MAIMVNGRVLTALNSRAFCKVCQHSVYDMAKHIKSDDHRRNVRRATGDSSRKPRALIGVNRATTGVRY